MGKRTRLARQTIRFKGNIVKCKVPKGPLPSTPTNKVQRVSPRKKVIRSKGNVTRKTSTGNTALVDW